MENQITLLEKYFPKDWDELILPSRVKKELSEAKSKNGYRILLHSSPGTGKTTTSRIMTLGSNYEVLYLSGSNDYNVELHRTKTIPFCGGFSVMNKQKNLIIDECENIADKIQDSFKILLDKSKKINFIFITNELPKVNDAILSRCSIIDYNFNSEELEEQKQNFIKFVLNICKVENITYENPGLKALFQLDFPDFRKTLIHLDKFYSIDESITLDNVKKLSESGKQLPELYSIIENNKLSNKEYYMEISKYKGKEKECLISLGEPFFEYLNSKELFDKTLSASIIVSKYSQMFLQTINKFSTFFSCTTELKTLFR